MFCLMTSPVVSFVFFLWSCFLFFLLFWYFACLSWHFSINLLYFYFVIILVCFFAPEGTLFAQSLSMYNNILIILLLVALTLLLQVLKKTFTGKSACHWFCHLILLAELEDALFKMLSQVTLLTDHFTILVQIGILKWPSNTLQIFKIVRQSKPPFWSSGFDSIKVIYFALLSFKASLLIPSKVMTLPLASWMHHYSLCK